MEKALNLTVLLGRGLSQAQAAPYIARAGFGSCFYTAREEDPVSPALQAAREAGLRVDFIHAPVSGIDTLWMEGEQGRLQLERLCGWVRCCAAHQVPVMVSHVWTKYAPIEPGELGISRFYTLLETARREGVRIAFENAEVDCFLSAVKAHLWSHPAAGFCYDTGHEQCYSEGRDQLELYGDKLLCTHFNDNLGRTGQTFTSADDAHMMPFDGIAPWERIAAGIARLAFPGPLTFEIKTAGKPGRHTHDRYAPIPDAEIPRHIFEKARILESMILRQKP